MTRKLIVATLALSPFMLHAQANSPAQPQAVSRVSGLSSVQVSTGFTAPKLIQAVDIVEGSEPMRFFDNNRKVLVTMTVDQTGKPLDVKILQPADSDLDKRVLASVSQYRFTPGMLDNQPVASPVSLEVVVTNSVR